MTKNTKKEKLGMKCHQDFAKPPIYAYETRKPHACLGLLQFQERHEKALPNISYLPNIGVLFKQGACPQTYIEPLGNGRET